MARVLNLKNTDYKIPEGAVYVGRDMPSYSLSASKWGNPFAIGRDGTREEVVAKYANWLDGMIYNGMLDLDELQSKDLVCWCHTWDGKGENPRYCHADILLELANPK